MAGRSNEGAPKYSLVKAALDFACTPVARLLVALVALVGLVVLLLRQEPVPDAYWAMVGAIIGFYFGGNVGAQ